MRVAAISPELADRPDRKQGSDMEPENSSPFFYRCRVGSVRAKDDLSGPDGSAGSPGGRACFNENRKGDCAKREPEATGDKGENGGEGGTQKKDGEIQG